MELHNRFLILIHLNKIIVPNEISKIKILHTCLWYKCFHHQSIAYFPSQFKLSLTVKTSWSPTLTQLNICRWSPHSSKAHQPKAKPPHWPQIYYCQTVVPPWFQPLAFLCAAHSARILVSLLFGLGPLSWIFFFSRV